MSATSKTDAWVIALLRAHGIQTVRWGDGSVGLLNVPGKWCALIGDLSDALSCVAAGESLPKINPSPKSKNSKRKAVT